MDHNSLSGSSTPTPVSAPADRRKLPLPGNLRIDEFGRAGYRDTSVPEHPLEPVEVDAADRQHAPRQMQATEEGFVIVYAHSGRPVELIRTETSVSRCLHDYLAKDGIELSLQLSRMRDVHREARIAELVRATTHCQGRFDTAISILLDTARTPTRPYGWQINAAFGIDLAHFLSHLQAHEQRFLASNITRWVDQHLHQSILLSGQLIVMKTEMGRALGHISEVVVSLGLYKVVQAGKTCHRHSKVVDMFFEDVEVASSEFIQAHNERNARRPRCIRRGCNWHDGKGPGIFPR